MSKLRIFKLGSLEHRLLPTPKTVKRLANILKRWDGVSDLNIVWGPDIEVLEFDVEPATYEVATAGVTDIPIENPNPGEEAA